MEFKNFVLDLAKKLSTQELALISVFCLISMCFMVVAFMLVKKKLLSSMCFFMGVVILFAVPFAVRYVMEEKFYRVNISLSRDQILRYIDVYYLDADIENIGTKRIKGCYVVHKILYDTDTESKIRNMKHGLLNQIKPLKVYRKDIELDMKPGERANVNLHINGYGPKGHAYKNYIECYGR